MSEHDVRSPSLASFLEDLGSGAPTPGGGTAAAVTGATGAALVRMLALLSLERPAYAEHDKLMRAIAEQAAEERETLLDLADQDAAAYAAVLTALKLPQATAEEQKARAEAVQAAFRRACDVPLRVMERCLDVIALAKTAVEHGNKNAASDGAAGGELARAAMRVASYNVKINLGSITDEAYVHEARGRMDEIDYMGGSAASAIDSRVNDIWSTATPTAGS